MSPLQCYLKKHRVYGSAVPQSEPIASNKEILVLQQEVNCLTVGLVWLRVKGHLLMHAVILKIINEGIK